MNCLARGRAGVGAEWSLTVFTTDGDPITTYYRVVAGTPEVEIFLDRSRDTYQGGDGWKQLTCTVPTITGASLESCTDSI